MARRDFQSTGVVGRLWRLVSQPAVLGLVMAGAGLLMALAPLSEPAQTWTGSWWVEPFRQPGVMRAAMAVVAAAVVVGAAALVARARSGRLIAWIGVAALGAGVAVGLGHWMVLQDDVPPTRVPMPVGTTLDSFDTTLDGQSSEVMFPLRVEATGVQRSPTRVDIEVSRAGGETVGDYQLEPGRSMELEGYRLTPVGLDLEEGATRAILSSSAPDTITVGAAPGESFQFAPDGESWELVETTENYGRGMGPAARVAHPELGELWVFQRAGEADPAPDFPHDLRLERLERAPAPVLMVAPASPMWPLTLGGALVVVGITAILFFPAGGPVAVGRDSDVRESTRSDDTSESGEEQPT